MKYFFRLSFAIMLAISPFALAQQDQIDEAPPAHEARRELREHAPPDRMQRGRGMHGGDGSMAHMLKNERVAKALELSEDQREQLKDVMQRLAAQRKALKSQLHDTAMHQAKLLTADEINEDELMDAVEATGKVRTELAKIEMRGLMANHQILTKKQHRQMREMMQRRRNEFMHKRGPHDRDRGAAKKRAGGTDSGPQPQSE
ncbi:MAG: Spy/CpxP family protein refolding chaperone [Candidatus Promineifilaceae bacterium]|jgi:Spy/CpxP family protein refolding chaperone